MKPPKRLTEFAIDMKAATVLLLQEDQLQRLDEHAIALGAEFHIYLIGSMPRVTFDPSSFVTGAATFSGDVLIHDGASTERKRFEVAQSKQGQITEIKSPWPHTSFDAFAGTEQLLSAKWALFASQVLRPYPNFEFDVLYVGQAYGPNGDRNASQRLQSHATLQKILGEASRLHPDREIWIILCDFEPLLFMQFDGRLANDNPELLEGDEERTNEMFRRRISRQQEINVTEAALIRYFNPPHNKTFRKTFPSPAHTTYSECYDLDFNSVAFELDCSDLFIRVRSGTRSPSPLHFELFPLHDAKERRSMLDALLPD